MVAEEGGGGVVGEAEFGGEGGFRRMAEEGAPAKGKELLGLAKAAGAAGGEEDGGYREHGVSGYVLGARFRCEVDGRGAFPQFESAKMQIAVVSLAPWLPSGPTLSSIDARASDGRADIDRRRAARSAKRSCVTTGHPQAK